MSKPKILDPTKVIGWKSPLSQTTFDEKDAILYALGIGFSQDPLKQGDYKYTYELHENFTVFPTMVTVIPKLNLVAFLLQHEYIPEFNPAMLLHGEQRIQLLARSLKPGAIYFSQAEIVDVIDKGKITLFIFFISTYQKEQNQKKLAFIGESILIVKGLANFGFKGKNRIKNIPNIPKHKQDKILQASSYANQAFVYRLSGDWNPLHVDPDFAAMQKFKQPILHGLATSGVVAKTIVEHIFNGQTQRLKAFNCRFTGHVFPGQSYQIKIWKQNNGLFIYSVMVKQRKTNVLAGSFESRQIANL